MLELNVAIVTIIVANEKLVTKMKICFVLFSFIRIFATSMEETSKIPQELQYLYEWDYLEDTFHQYYLSW